MSPCCDLLIRRAQPYDWERVTAVMPLWWGGRDLRALLPSIFFEHFRTTSFVAEHEEKLVGFLVGFLCPTHDDEAYVHFVGVDPAWRRAGLARDLYGRFCEVARADGRRSVRAVTSVVNRDSIAFHQRLGFVALPGDLEADGLPATAELGVPEGAVVRFELRLDEPPAPELRFDDPTVSALRGDDLAALAPRFDDPAAPAPASSSPPAHGHD